MRQNLYKCPFTLHNNLARDIFIDVNEDKELIADIIDNDTLEDAVDDQGNKVPQWLNHDYKCNKLGLSWGSTRLRQLAWN